MNSNRNPKVFVSYCWTTKNHEQWVIDLLTRLREDGVDIKLDKWDLKEGNDAIKFMESMVNDPEINKVIIICDKEYARKANERKGGVGTETQIISSEIYQKADQNKFVAIIPEKDENGKPFLPTYYKSRIYIDLSESENYEMNYELLLRWIYNKPLHTKPTLGKKPVFLDENSRISLRTTSIYNRAINAIKEGKSTSNGIIKEYFETFSENLEEFRITSNETDGIEFDEKVINSIDTFLPYRNEMILLISTITKYSIAKDNILSIHKFFESLLPYMYPPEGINSWSKCYYDNYKFIIHELFLNTIAILLKHEKFEQANILLSKLYYLEENVSRVENKTTSSFTIFRKYLESFEERNKRLNLGRLSLRADMLRKRTEHSIVKFQELMQADFVLFIRGEIETIIVDDTWIQWWPETLVYVHRRYNPFEIFARATSKKYFDNMKQILGIEKVDELIELINLYRTQKRKLPSWGFNYFNPQVLLGIDEIEKKD
jgi:hypothetical protein